MKNDAYYISKLREATDRRTQLAIVKYQERAARYADDARHFMDIYPAMAINFQRESAIDYQVARNLMGVENA